MDVKKRKGVDVANEPVDIDDEGIVDTGVLHEDDDDDEEGSDG